LKIYFSYPSKIVLNQFLTTMQNAPFSYTEIGYTKMDNNLNTKNKTKDLLLRNYTIDYNHACIGEGTEVWEKARLALKQWKHSPPSFTKIYNNTKGIKEGTIVAVMIKILGIWWRNSAKIVYVIDKPDCFGFAYGSLLEHAEQGEEAFWISRDSTGRITYHLKAFSKPKFWAAKLAYPLTRKYQHKFAQESLQQMKYICTV